MNLFLKIVISVLLCSSLGFASGFLLGSPLSEWYQALNKPFFQPPNWIFGPVWTILYILMGISFALIWNLKPNTEKKKIGLSLFGLQLFLNLVWTPLFFRFHLIQIALFVLIALVIILAFTVYKFYGLDKRASYLLLPYLLWVSFAMILNAAIVILN